MADTLPDPTEPEPLLVDAPRLLEHREALGLYAFHKPSGMPVHPGNPGGPEDLLTWIRRQPGLPRGLAPINRIDADASGLVLFAADPAVRGEYGKRFAEGSVEKTYLCLVHGRARKKGVINRPLADARRGRPLPALSRYRSLEWIGAFTLVAIRPETGRKHQLRRHLQSIGHAVVGDERYHPRRFRPIPAYPGRLWLHARLLSFPDGGPIFEDPLPPELIRNLVALREGAARLEGTLDEGDDEGEGEGDDEGADDEGGALDDDDGSGEE